MTEQVTFTEFLGWLFNDSVEDFCRREIPRDYDLQGLTKSQFEDLLAEKIKAALNERLLKKFDSLDEMLQEVRNISTNFTLLAGKWGDPQYIATGYAIEKVFQDRVDAIYAKVLNKREAK